MNFLCQIWRNFSKYVLEYISKYLKVYHLQIMWITNSTPQEWLNNWVRLSSAGILVLMNLSKKIKSSEIKTMWIIWLQKHIIGYIKHVNKLKKPGCITLHFTLFHSPRSLQEEANGEYNSRGGNFWHKAHVTDFDASGGQDWRDQEIWRTTGNVYGRGRCKWLLYSIKSCFVKKKINVAKLKLEPVQ